LRVIHYKKSNRSSQNASFSNSKSEALASGPALNDLKPITVYVVKARTVTELLLAKQPNLLFDGH